MFLTDWLTGWTKWNISNKTRGICIKITLKSFSHRTTIWIATACASVQNANSAHLPHLLWYFFSICASSFSYLIYSNQFKPNPHTHTSTVSIGWLFPFRSSLTDWEELKSHYHFLVWTVPMKKKTPDVIVIVCDEFIWRAIDAVENFAVRENEWYSVLFWSVLWLGWKPRLTIY